MGGSVNYLTLAQVIILMFTCLSPMPALNPLSPALSVCLSPTHVCMLSLSKVTNEKTYLLIPFYILIENEIQGSLGGSVG